MRLPPATYKFPCKSDLDYVFNAVGTAWVQLKNQAIFITGGTGIIGKWLIVTLLHADRILGLGVEITILSRNPMAFCLEWPELAADARINWITGDVKNFELKRYVSFSYVIHAATDVVRANVAEELLESCIIGTSRVIKFSRLCGASRFLLLSSGAVYGKTPPELGAIPETFVGELNWFSPDSAYAEGKRVSELLCVAENAKGEMTIPIARCFAMTGPYLPLNKHFAIGNFIDALINKKPLIIKGDGTPVRSYLYMADVAIRLWMLLFGGSGGVAYNIGSDQPISIEGLARLIVRKFDGSLPIQIENRPTPGAHAHAYYPDTSRLRNEFGIGSGIDIEEALEKTIVWHMLQQRRSV